ncbi:MAG: peptide chain release factor N(5)-glutamine methyltransferase [Anaerolineae bacterium]|nr:peptide chain release factor N(5)-glutamine methyltransferase [Gemmatimonadaceae bacterium]
MGSGDRARRFARALATGQYQLGTGLVADRTVHDLIGEIAALLSQARIPDPRREATDIVAAVLDVPRLWPAVHRQELISQNSQSLALRASAHRAMGAPFAYSVGRAAFRHLNLEVDDRVLIPRQETEILVEAVLNHANTAGGLAVDIGTGSGAIALSLASEARFEQVVGTDISTGALAIARANASRVAPLLNSRVEFRHGSFLAPVAELRARVVVSNPPYVATAEAFSLPASVRDWEPPVALFSGGDGMVATERIIRDAACVLEPFDLLALEVDSRRAPLAARLAADTTQYHHITILPDLTGRDRILLATRTDR